MPAVLWSPDPIGAQSTAQEDTTLSPKAYFPQPGLCTCHQKAWELQLYFPGMVTVPPHHFLSPPSPSSNVWSGNRIGHFMKVLQSTTYLTPKSDNVTTSSLPNISFSPLKCISVKRWHNMLPQESVTCRIFKTDKKTNHFSKVYYATPLFNASIFHGDRKIHVPDLPSHRDIKHMMLLEKRQWSDIFTGKNGIDLILNFWQEPAGWSLIISSPGQTEAWSLEGLYLARTRAICNCTL